MREPRSDAARIAHGLIEDNEPEGYAPRDLREDWREENGPLNTAIDELLQEHAIHLRDGRYHLGAAPAPAPKPPEPAREEREAMAAKKVKREGKCETCGKQFDCAPVGIIPKKCPKHRKAAKSRPVEKASRKKKARTAALRRAAPARVVRAPRANGELVVTAAEAAEALAKVEAWVRQTRRLLEALA